MYELECTIWVLFSWALKGRTQEWVHWPPLRPQTKTGWVPEGHAATILWVKFCRMPIVWPLTPPPPRIYVCLPPEQSPALPPPQGYGAMTKSFLGALAETSNQTYNHLLESTQPFNQNPPIFLAHHIFPSSECIKVVRCVGQCWGKTCEK